MKIKMFTHMDLDGVSCEILGYAAFGEENVDVVNCNYDRVDFFIQDFLLTGLSKETYDLILITDISVNEATAEMIEALKDQIPKVQLLDHHETANWLNRYDWASVTQKHGNGDNSSGTSMLLDYLEENEYITSEQASHWKEGYVEAVRRYDTWDWFNIFHDEFPKQLNDLFYLLPQSDFIFNVLKQLSIHGSFVFTEEHELILNIEQKRIERYIEEQFRQMVTTSIGKYTVGVVFGEQYISETCNALHRKKPELDLIAMINLKNKKISYRTTHDEVDVSKFASYFGGGGRPQTAGSELDDNQIHDLMNLIFDV